MKWVAYMLVVAMVVVAFKKAENAVCSILEGDCDEHEKPFALDG